jgi:tryptophan-rich sensory protein
MSEGSVSVFILMFIMGTFSAAALWAGGEIEGHDALWWPLSLAKLFIRSLWKVLFTEWKS